MDGPSRSSPAAAGKAEYRPEPRAGAERLLTLDAMRGIAALAVLLIHIGYFSGQRWLAPFAFLSVDLFFMISGFVIGFAFERKLLDGMGWGRFMAFRLARIYPSLLLGLLIGVVAHFVAPPGNYSLGWHSLGHLLLIPALFSASIFPLNGALWTLFFELAVNAAHGLVVRHLTTPRLLCFVLVAGAAWGWAALSLGDWGAGWTARTFLAGFARVGWGYGVGLLLYRLFVSGRWKLPRISFLAPIGAAALLLLVPDIGGAFYRTLASLFLLLPLIVLAAASSDVAAPARPAARWLAWISYPLYAIHLPLLLIAASLIGHRPEPAAWPMAGLVVILLATAAAYFYDSPIRVWLRPRLPTERAAAAANVTLPAGARTVYSAASVTRRPGPFFAAAREDLRRTGPVAWRLFLSDLRVRRRKSLLGHAWLVLPAAATAIICAYLQSRRIVALPEAAIPYPFFVLSGVLIWQTFSEAVASPLQNLAGMRHLTTRSHVPHEAVILAGAGGVLLNAAVRLTLLIAALPLFGLDLSPALLLLPVAFVALVLLGIVVGLILTPFGLLYDDVGRALPILILFWFLLSPILYPIPAGEAWLRLNPVAPLIDAARSALVAAPLPAGFYTVVAAAAAALPVVMLFYRLARPHLAARLA